ncbi:MAG: diacylglycerol kinase family lipid kinase [Actinobacteria bacterium]|nr:MAG: diacylglycerol kinase family lipid kinase [Actinomycetota bacterium]
MPPPETALERAEELAERVVPHRRDKRRMLVIVNPYATTVSDRLKHLVVYALQGRYSVEAVDTEARAHATEICREAAAEGYDVVVAFGGDGTVNEAANGLIGSDTPLTVLPGGSTNVLCRTFGIPADVVDATEHLLGMADRFQPVRIDLGRAGDRYFTFTAGIGLDASVVERVDAHPRLKARYGEWFFTYAALMTFNRRYLVRPPRVRAEIGDATLDGVTVIVQNSDPYTYFGRRPIRICEGADPINGRLSAAVLKRATPFEIPTLIPRLFANRPGAVLRHRQIEGFQDLTSLRVVSTEESPFPLQVDGDYVGEFDELDFGVSPAALTVVS